LATTNKNFKVKNGLEVAGEIGVGSTPSYGTAGQILSSQGAGNSAAWIDVSAGAAYTSIVKHDVILGEAITKGQAVYVSSSNGSNMIVSKASNASEATSSKTLGLLESSGSTNNQRNVVTEGLLGGIDVGAASAGDPIWLGTGGNLIYGLTNKPIAPAHLVFIGIVTKTGNNGEIFVRIQNGFELNELHTVLIGTDYTANSIPGDNEFLAYNLETNLWINQTAEEAGVANLSGATFTGNVTITGPSQLVGTIKTDSIYNSVSGNKVFAASTNSFGEGNGSTEFYGNGSNLTSLNATNISSGTIANARTSANTANSANTIVARDVTGSFTANDIYATNFNGNVNAITVIGNTNASTITTGTIANARTTASDANGASTIVARNVNGSFTANIITANLTGTAEIATKVNTISQGATDANRYLTFVDSNNLSGEEILYTHGALYYNAVDASLYSNNFRGSGTNLTNIPAANITGTVADGTTTTAARGVGYMGLPQSSAATTGAYAVLASDAGEHIYTTGTRTVTIPANSNVAFPIGSTLVFINGNATLTIAITSDTMNLSVIGTTGSRTLAPYGMATAIKVASTTWIISGNGLT
jgi:hypothetical protein